MSGSTDTSLSEIVFGMLNEIPQHEPRVQIQ